jgi:hypothetical protein
MAGEDTAAADTQLSEADWVLKKVFGEAFKFEAVPEEDSSTCNEPASITVDSQQPRLEAKQSEAEVKEQEQPSAVPEKDGTWAVSDDRSHPPPLLMLPSAEEGKNGMSSADDYSYSFLCLTCAQEYIGLESEDESDSE